MKNLGSLVVATLAVAAAFMLLVLAATPSSAGGDAEMLYRIAYGGAATRP